MTHGRTTRVLGRLTALATAAALAALPGRAAAQSAAGPGGPADADPGPVSIDRLLAITPAVGGETPRWSPDGSRLLVASGFTGGLATVPAGGGFPRPVPVGIGEAGHFLASQTPRWSPDGRWISYVSAKSGAPEIWLWSTGTGEEHQLTRAGGRLVSAYRWSPDGSRIAFSTDRNGDMDVWTVSVPDGRMRRLAGGARYQVFPTWAPDGASVLYVELSEDWTEHEIREIPAPPGDGGGSGESRLVVRDTDFFDYGAGADFGYPRVSPDGDRVLFPSHRSGWINYWSVPRAGGEPRRIAPESADQSHARWSPDGERIAFVSNRNGTRVLRVVAADGGEARTLVAPEGRTGTDGTGVISDPEWSPDGTRISYTLETPTSPRDLWVVDVESGRRTRLTRSMPEGGLGERLVAPEKVSYESTDGFTIHAYLYRPPSAADGTGAAGAAGSAGHPAIVWTHGGPTSQWEDEFQPHVQYFVQRGYVVLMPNIRGSSGYGKAFEDANNGCWSHCDLEDVRAGAEYLRSLPYVRDDALAITGTSYGGIMTMAAVSFAPGLFQAAISQSGYGDWVAFMEGDNELRHQKLLEYELGAWPENREAYRRASAIYSVEDATTPVFLVHGTGRYPGSPQSHQYAGALQEHYKVFRYETYPGETYYVYGRENRRRLLRDMEAFLEVYLKDEPRELPGARTVAEGG